ncbi:metallopeptidase family protein [Jannaschia sp. R86511]|uniref:metallopeptidase family protein n=1 Tax=Jannaschia sp. R86511 TaxID=3093853 RepID=UPI0036D39716
MTTSTTSDGLAEASEPRPGPHALLDQAEFEKVVAEVVDTLPDEVAGLLAQVALLVQDEEDDAGDHPGRRLLGVYRGIPRTRYGGRPSGVLPDTITLYRLPILSGCARREDVPGRVRTVLLHEVGHAVGLSEHRLRELGVF